MRRRWPVPVSGARATATKGYCTGSSSSPPWRRSAAGAAPWTRWLDRQSPLLDDRPCVAPMLTGRMIGRRSTTARGSSASGRSLPRPGPSSFDARAQRARCRNGTAGASLREERLQAEEPWLARWSGRRGSWPWCGPASRSSRSATSPTPPSTSCSTCATATGHATPLAVDRAVEVRLHLAREAAAGDLQWEGLLTWLREAARLVIARRSAQLEIPVAW